MSRLALPSLAAFVCAASLFAPSAAHAADRRTEAAALDALKKAAKDYKASDYDAALSRLLKAIKACGTNRCTNPTRAALQRDVGTMLFRQDDKDGARKSFGEALRLDPELPLNPSYDAPDLRAAWRQAGGQGAGAANAGGPPSGAFDHTPAAAQKVNTPLPVFAGGADPDVRRVVLRYRAGGMTEWKRIEMKKVDGGWAGTIPCGDVTLGTMSYYLLGYDENGDPVASNGNSQHPYTVSIQDEIDGEAPHLPGQRPPRTCDEANEEGATTNPEENGEQEKETGKKEGNGYARVWVGVSGMFDIMSLSQGSDLCRLYPQPPPAGQVAGTPANSSNYYCTNPDGSDFPSRSSSTQNDALIKGQAGNVGGGPAIGTLHIMLAVDVAVTPNILAGGRLGWVFNGYPGQAATQDGRAFGPKFHLEARAAYVFGDNPLGHEGAAPMVFAGAGVAAFDAHSDGTVRLQSFAGSQPVSMWRTGGPGFVAAGGGARYSFSARYAFTALLRGNLAFGGGGLLPSFGPELSLQYGF
jgi:hypothetical protein